MICSECVYVVQLLSLCLICASWHFQSSAIFVSNSVDCYVYQTCHMIRITVSDTDLGGFLSDTAVLRFDTDFN